ncbi:MAG: 4a-hydroxytetrahydrobiopterin dehydratase [Deltaproteobacteria bacterium]|nr:4a-hydroxytetrahydrobiopterin dehydratase [Deltaproteobacteria bacterium]
MGELATMQCVPCRGGVPPLAKTAADALLAKLSGWEIVNNHHLTKSYEFPDFVQALEFVNRIGAVAEEQGHHPDIALSWGKVRTEIWTHKIDGLTESDFILADKIDQLR